MVQFFAFNYSPLFSLLSSSFVVEQLTLLAQALVVMVKEGWVGDNMHRGGNACQHMACQILQKFGARAAVLLLIEGKHYLFYIYNANANTMAAGTELRGGRGKCYACMLLVCQRRWFWSKVLCT